MQRFDVVLHLPQLYMQQLVYTELNIFCLQSVGGVPFVRKSENWLQKSSECNSVEKKQWTAAHGMESELFAFLKWQDSFIFFRKSF